MHACVLSVIHFISISTFTALLFSLHSNFFLVLIMYCTLDKQTYLGICVMRKKMLVTFSFIEASNINCTILDVHCFVMFDLMFSYCCFQSLLLN